MGKIINDKSNDNFYIASTGITIGGRTKHYATYADMLADPSPGKYAQVDDARVINGIGDASIKGVNNRTGAIYKRNTVNGHFVWEKVYEAESMDMESQFTLTALGINATADEVNNTVEQAHTHTNQGTLDKLVIDGEKLTFQCGEEKSVTLSDTTDDIARLTNESANHATAIQSNNKDITNLQAALATKLDKPSDVDTAVGMILTKTETGSAWKVNDKAEKKHTHLSKDIIDLQSTLNGKIDKPADEVVSNAVLTKTDNGTDWVALPTNIGILNNTINENNGVVQLVDGKIPAELYDKTSTDGLVTDTALNAALNTKADISALADKANKADLDNKVNTIDLQTALADKADKSHTHVCANITDLQDTLNSKADTKTVETLQATLADKADKNALNNKLDKPTKNTIAIGTVPTKLNDNGDIEWKPLPTISKDTTTLGNVVNKQNGLVQLDNNGKIPNSLYDTTSDDGLVTNTVLNTALDKKAAASVVTALQNNLNTKAEASALATKADKITHWTTTKPVNGEFLIIKYQAITDTNTELSRNSIETETVINTGRGINADKVKVYNEYGENGIWESCPVDGLGSTYDNAAVMVDLSAIPQPCMLYYCWYNIDQDNVVHEGDWRSQRLPTFTSEDFNRINSNAYVSRQEFENTINELKALINPSTGN